MRSTGDPRAIVGGTFVVAMFAWGLAFYGLGFYLQQLHVRFDWSLSSLSLVTLAFHLTATVASFGVSAALRRVGPRPVFAVGALLLAAGVLGVGHVEARGQLVGVYVVMAFGWASLNSNPISATVLDWYPTRSGPPLAIALTGASVGGVLLIPTLTWATERHGLRWALSWAAGIELLVVGAVALAVIRPAPRRADETAASLGGSGSGSGGGSACEVRAQRRGLLRRRAFWRLSAALALAIAAQVGLLVHQLTLLTQSMSASTAARIVALTTVAALGGRLVFIAVANRVAVARLGAGYLAVQAIALAGLAVGGGGVAALTALSMLFGSGVGVLITIPPLLTRVTFPEVAFTVAFPVVNVGYQLALASGPMLTALGHDHLGGYGPTMAILALADAAAALLLLRTPAVDEVATG